MATKSKGFNGYLTEDQMISRFGLTKLQLDSLRNSSGMPYVELTRQLRLYPEAQITRWFEQNIKNGVSD